MTHEQKLHNMCISYDGTATKILALKILSNYGNYLFIYLFENLEEPSTMPRPLALTGITVHIKSITSNDKNKIAYKWFYNQ